MWIFFLKITHVLLVLLLKNIFRLFYSRTKKFNQVPNSLTLTYSLPHSLYKLPLHFTSFMINLPVDVRSMILFFLGAYKWRQWQLKCSRWSYRHQICSIYFNGFFLSLPRVYENLFKENGSGVRGCQSLIILCLNEITTLKFILCGNKYIYTIHIQFSHQTHQFTYAIICNSIESLILTRSGVKRKNSWNYLQCESWILTPGVNCCFFLVDCLKIHFIVLFYISNKVLNVFFLWVVTSL